MSLRKPPTLTPALLAANRQNAKKSTGPRTPRGKVWSRLNRLRHGGFSAEYSNFYDALLNAPPGPARVALVARAILASKPVQHPLFTELAEVSIQAEIELCPDSRRNYRQAKSKKDFFTFEPGMLLITKIEKTAISIAPDKL